MFYIPISIDFDDLFFKELIELLLQILCPLKGGIGQFEKFRKVNCAKRLGRGKISIWQHALKIILPGWKDEEQYESPEIHATTSPSVPPSNLMVP